MIVVDTNVIAYLLLESEQTASTEVVAHKDPDWVAPHLWRSEFRNVLVLNMRQARIEPDDALRLIAKAEISECQTSEALFAGTLPGDARVCGRGRQQCTVRLAHVPIGERFVIACLEERRVVATRDLEGICQR